MKKTKVLLTCFLIFFPFLIKAQVIPPSLFKIMVISDIDDTLKVASSRNKFEFLTLMNSTTQYTGMSELFKALGMSWGTQIQFAYVTNAPIYIESSRKIFLATNNFRDGSVYYNTKYPDQTHKVTAIRQILTENKPTHVIFLGDNAERDPQVYQQISQEYKSQGIQIFTFIHRLFKDQGVVDFSQNFSYITSVEVAQKLRMENLLAEKDYQDFFSLVIPQIETEIDQNQSLIKNSQAFPQFMICTDFKWSLPFESHLSKIQNYLLKRCH